MKKFATIAAVMATALGAFAQGTVVFQNSASSLVKWGAGVSGQTEGTSVAAAADVKVGLYYMSAPGTYTLVSTQFPIVGTSSSGTPNAALNGRFTGNPTTLTVTGLTAGQNGTFQVRAWSGPYTSYEAATTGGATYLGSSADFVNASGGAVDPVTGIAGPAATLSGFSGLNVGSGAVIPEPSTFALAGLGLGALLLIRRRK